MLGRILSIQKKTETTVQMVMEMGARIIRPCRKSRKRLRGILRRDMWSRLKPKIRQYPRRQQIIKKTMETLVTRKVSIVLGPQYGSKRKNISKGCRSLLPLWYPHHHDGRDSLAAGHIQKDDLPVLYR